MTKSALIFLIIGLVIIGALAYVGFKTPVNTPTPSVSPTTTISHSPTPTTTNSTDHTNLIQVTSPSPNTVVKSPLTITGQARGNWYFEASFPVKIYDNYGRLLGSTPAQAQGEWMTQDFVPFKATLNFDTPSTDTGKLVLEKDNPSGLPQNADQIEIPIKFNLSSYPQRTVKLYYYNSDKDKDQNGNILCSSQGLVTVQRQIPSTATPIQDTLKLLLQGNLTSPEKNQGITTEYPLPGLNLTSASLKNGVLTLTFEDPQSKTSGGSCRVSVLWAQIEATAKQFSGVSSVKFMPEDLFQP